MKITISIAALLVPVSLFAAGATLSPPTATPLTVSVRPWGPDQALLDATKSMVASQPAVTQYLAGTRNRLLWLDILDGKQGQPPDRFRVTFFDYTHNRAVMATGMFNVPSSVTATVSRTQPAPSNDEFVAAVDLLAADPYFGPLLARGELKPYQPMPAVIENNTFTLQNDRIITVGLWSPKGTAQNEVAGANLSRNTVVRFPNFAPPTSMANSSACGIPPAGQPTTSRGTAGQYQVQLLQNGVPIWSMIVIRPSASSGTRGSGIEIQEVYYNGKRVMKRGHVPMLNVQYAGNACGPYRDWQWQESELDTHFAASGGTDVAPGIRQCNVMPQTMMDNGTDTGDFAGVAYYISGTELVMKAEMEAGWYRYVHEWHFDVNGTIRPRFAFGATSSSCVCNTHTHHAYFRFDFDIDTPEKNVVWEVNGRDIMTRKTTEGMTPRSPTTSRRWIVENPDTGDKYLIQPNAIDGLYDTYGRGDVWWLRYHDNAELDDGHNSTGGDTEVDLAQFVNGESIDKQDVVMWYGTHSVHIGGELDEDFVGPDIIPLKW